MPIQLICPQCRNPFAARDESAGRRVKCPGCGAVLAVPAPSGTVPPPAAPGGGGSGLLEPVSPSELRSIRVVEEPPAPRRVVSPPPPPPARKTISAPAGPTADVLIPEEDVDSWNAVRRGLARVRLGVALMILPILANTAHFLYRSLMSDSGPPPEGKIPNLGLNLYQEIELGVFAFFGVLSFLLLFFGRLSCGAAPSFTQAKGRALGSAFWTFIAFGGLAVAVTSFFVPQVKHLWFPAATVGFTVFLVMGLVAEFLFLQSVSQLGVALGDRKICSGVGGLTVLAGFFATVLLLATPYQQIARDSEQLPKDVENYMITPSWDTLTKATTTIGVGVGRTDLAHQALDPEDPRIRPWARSVGTSGLIVLASLLVMLSYVGVLSRARNSIKRRMPDQT